MNAQGNDYQQPLPSTVGLNGAFYAWCRKGELRFQRCTRCHGFRHVPREMCARCGAFDWEWVRSNGRGTVFTWTEVVRALHPAFADETPYAPVIVELEEGVRIVSRVLDCPVEELVIGMPVVVSFVAVTEEMTLPMFRRATA